MPLLRLLPICSALAFVADAPIALPPPRYAVISTLRQRHMLLLDCAICRARRRVLEQLLFFFFTFFAMSPFILIFLLRAVIYFFSCLVSSYITFRFSFFIRYISAVSLFMFSSDTFLHFLFSPFFFALHEHVFAFFILWGKPYLFHFERVSSIFAAFIDYSFLLLLRASSPFSCAFLFAFLRFFSSSAVIPLHHGFRARAFFMARYTLLISVSSAAIINLLPDSDTVYTSFAYVSSSHTFASWWCRHYSPRLRFSIRLRLPFLICYALWLKSADEMLLYIYSYLYAIYFLLHIIFLYFLSSSFFSACYYAFESLWFSHFLQQFVLFSCYFSIHALFSQAFHISSAFIFIFIALSFFSCRFLSALISGHVI